MDTTFTVLLHACSHGGVPDTALHYLETMQSQFGIAPTNIHRTCVIDAMGRMGRLAEAEKLADEIEDAVAWKTVLAACRKFNDHPVS